ncbi:MAG: sigma-70 family RNA polymerase sigma factor [Polyangiales bacterium]
MSGTSTAAITREALAQADGLYRLARRLTGSNADAEELVQETFARALGARDPMRVGSNVRAWLYRILRNAHIDALRRRRANPVSLSRDGEDLDAASVDGEMLRDDRELDRLRGLVAEEIERALATLSPDARTIVLLDHEGLSEVELAEVLGCAIGTVKSRLSRARVALRAKLSEYAR